MQTSQNQILKIEIYQQISIEVKIWNKLIINSINFSVKPKELKFQNNLCIHNKYGKVLFNKFIFKKFHQKIIVLD
jgi:hypothetical protein